MERMMNSPQEVERLQREYPVTTYMDRVLSRRRGRYLEPVRGLLARGLVRLLDPARVRARVGLFFVEKRGKSQSRLIIDARASNQFFRPPPTVRLISSEGLSRLEAGGASDVCRVVLGTADIKDAFHRFKIDDAYAAFFALPDVTFAEMRLEGSGSVAPCFGALPMGHSWSLYFCQTTGEHIMSQVPSLARSLRMMDSAPL